MKANRILATVAVVLLVLSVWVYHHSVTRAERFERGQRFLPNLNPDEIAAISITKGEETINLERADENFTVVSANGYPAKNETVIRFIKDVLELGLDKEVGSGADLEEELELVPGGENTVEVVFNDANDKEMVHFLVGKQFEGGSGSYLRRVTGEESEIFLSSKGLHLTTDEGSFLKKEILDVKREDIARIAGPDFVVSDTEDGLKLENVPGGREEKPSEMNKIKGVLTYLRFDEVFVADDSEVRGLGFQMNLEVELKDSSGYRLATAKKGDKSFLRISGFHKVTGVQVSRDETEEELEEKADILERSAEIESFNSFHGSWVYQISDTTAEKIGLKKVHLTQAKS
jgi:hypothetical protein